MRTARARPRGVGLLRAGAVVVALTGLLVGCSAASGDEQPGGSPGGIGAWPTFLPSPTPQGVPTGTLADPAMSFPGSPVLVEVGAAHALVDVEGPSYPASTKVGAEEVACTFTVRFSDLTAPVPLDGSSFSVLDGQGGLHPLVAAPHHRTPHRLEPGRAYTLSLVGVLPAGEGLLRYYPTTQGAVAAWDFVAETD